MARFRSLRPVNSTKHVIDSTGQLTLNVNSNTDLAVAVAPGTITETGTVNVPIGCTISSIFLSIFILGTSGSTSGLVDWHIRKNPSNQMVGADAPTPGSTGVSPNRRFIFHEEKGLYATQDGAPMVFKGVIKIPPRFRRMGDSDRLTVSIRSPNDGAEFCIKAIYKHFE